MAGKKGKSGGTNSKYTQENYEQMKTYLTAGLSLKDACTLVGIAYSTWNGYEQKDPSLRRERKKWQGMLKARAKLNIAEHIFGNKKKNISPSAGYSLQYLDRLVDQEAKNAQNAVNRATARKINAEVKRLEIETQLASLNLADLKQQIDDANNAEETNVDDLANAIEKGMEGLFDVDDEIET